MLYSDDHSCESTVDSDFSVEFLTTNTCVLTFRQGPEVHRLTIDLPPNSLPDHILPTETTRADPHHSAGPS